VDPLQVRVVVVTACRPSSEQTYDQGVYDMERRPMNAIQLSTWYKRRGYDIDACSSAIFGMNKTCCIKIIEKATFYFILLCFRWLGHSLFGFAFLVIVK
jgi:hypothetical protein